jgi:hypothetical protein
MLSLFAAFDTATGEVFRKTRKDRMLPLSPGRAESHGFDYKRN